MISNLKIAYIGGGSRGWAWGLMSDLASAGDISGEVFARVVQNKSTPDPRTLIGSGKVKELSDLLHTDVSTVTGKTLAEDLQTAENKD